MDLKNEITLLEEVKDIRDELNILKSIFEDQKDVLEKLFNLVAGLRLSKEQATDKNPIINYYRQRSDIDLRIEKIQKVQMDTTTTYDSVSLAAAEVATKLINTTDQSPSGSKAKGCQYL